jgi:hypothetical protein
VQLLIGLRYGGSVRHWGFGLYLASCDRYENQILLSGFPSDSLAEALDCARRLCLDGPPDQGRHDPRRTSETDNQAVLGEQPFRRFVSGLVASSRRPGFSW